MDEAKFTAERTKEKLEDLQKAVITVSYTDLANVSGPAKEFLTERGSITEDSRNKKLIVKDIPKVIQEIQDLVAELDTPEKQVLIEARIVEVDTTSNLDLGINWNIFYSQDATFDPDIQNSAGQVGLGGNFVVPAFAAGTGQSAGFGSEFSWGKVGVNTTILDLRLGALETAGEGQVISNPRIMTLNGEQAKISQGTMIPYQTVSADEIKTELVEAALSLEVTPIINPDNSVILEIKATNSTPGTTVATGAGAAPSIDTKEAETKMLVQDGDTMVIGGIYIEQDDYSENGVPILMHIPFIGNLFKSTKSNKNRTELMIFVTPRIVE
jgi:type IV pilus assembly protein PilQ